MNNNLISRSDLIAEIKRIGGKPFSDWDTMGVLALAERIPAVDAVEVVRCKDCKHFCPYEGEEHKGDCDELVGLESCVYEDDFCSYGERRADDADN